MGVVVKHIVKSAHGQCGLLLIENEGAVAAILVGDDAVADNSEKLAETLRLFQNRLNSMVDHTTTGELDLSKGSKCFIHDTETGEYREENIGPDNRN